jgi:hypothetical protein
MKSTPSRILRRIVSVCALIVLAILSSAQLASGHGSDGDVTEDPLPGPIETGPFSDATPAGGVSVPLSLSSRPGAPYTIYLDFGGFSFSGNWGNNGSYLPGVTPAYTNDGDASTFTAGEIANMTNIWARVAEKYAWANVNVTTIDPAVAAGQAGSDLSRQNYYDNTPKIMHTVIGGSGGWSGGGGISFVGVTGHAQPGSNGYHTDFVFSALAPNNLQFMGEASAHENGHGFGLNHQSIYNGTTLVNEYDSGDATRAPIMGNSYSKARGLWKIGISHGAFGPTTQNDIATILNTSNNPNIAIIDDGVGHTRPTATTLPLTGTNIDFGAAQGIITPSNTNPSTFGIANYSTDFWSFSAPGGTVSITVNAGGERITPGFIDPGATLDASLQILDSNGNVIASSITSNLSETITTSLVAGNYYAQVLSAADPTNTPNQNYFDVGSYFLSGSLLVPEPSTWILLLLGGFGLIYTVRAKANRC